MPQATAQLFLSLGGIQVNGTFLRTAVGQLSDQLTPDKLVAGAAGTLTTRTSDTAGIITLASAPTLVNGNKFSIVWANGSVLTATVTGVSGNAVTFNSAIGDVLPALNAAVVASLLLTVVAPFNGDLVEMMGAVCTNDAAIGFYDATPTLLLRLKLAGGTPQGEPWFWVKNSGVTNPLAGHIVATVSVGNGEAESGTFNLAALYDAA
jgi:hypothetical protein